MFVVGKYRFKYKYKHCSWLIPTSYSLGASPFTSYFPNGALPKCSKTAPQTRLEYAWMCQGSGSSNPFLGSVVSIFSRWAGWSWDKTSGAKRPWPHWLRKHPAIKMLTLSSKTDAIGRPPVAVKLYVHPTGSIYHDLSTTAVHPTWETQI